MKRTTIIIGEAGSGKSRKAIDLSTSYKSMFCHGLRDFRQDIKTLPTGTECIIIEGIEKRDYEEVIKMIKLKSVLVRQKYQTASKEVDMPILVFTTLSKAYREISKEADIEVEIIEL